MYFGYPNELKIEQGSVLKLETWRKMTDVNGVPLDASAVKAHVSLRIGERIYILLKTIIQKPAYMHPN